MSNQLEPRRTKLTIAQWSVLAGAFLLAAVLYFGFDTRPPSFDRVEAERAGSLKSTDLNGLLRVAKADVGTTDMGEIVALESRLHDVTEGDTVSQLASLEALSGKWYSLGKYGVAAGYAEQIAELRQTATAWNIAGANYVYCLQNEQEDKVKSYCTDRAVSAFETAAAMEPGNADHRINLALVYVENPPEDNPMRGIRMLLSLNEREPDNVNVLGQLGRLAIQTKQFDRAVERLEKAVSLQPQNLRVNCLLAEAYRGTGQTAQAEQFQSRCSALRKDLQNLN